MRDPLGHALNVIDEKKAVDGSDVYLTIDNTLQRKVEQVLEATRARWDAKAATAVDPRSAHGRRARDGRRAGLRREQVSASVSKDKQRNRAVTDTYEPGSTFKVVTLAGVLETGTVTPQDELRAPVLDRGRRPRHPRRGAIAARSG